MTDDRLTDKLAAEVLGWRTAPGRFIKNDRSWTPRHRFAPLTRLDDAFQLVDRVATSCNLTVVKGSRIAAEVQVGTRIGKASGDLKARTVTMALARALGAGGRFVKGVQPDIKEIFRALEPLAEPEQVIELRLLEVQAQGQRIPSTMSGYFDDFKLLASSAIKYGGIAKGVYITLNSVNPALLARASNRLRPVGKHDSLTGDADITKRRWLPIDLDPVRPSGISSTEQEHALAVERAFQIREEMRQVGWPNPVVGDSGNGAHLLYRVDLPAGDNELVKRCLQALARRFDDDQVKIDQAVFNPARIWKLYGTVSRKGDGVPERPHRLSRVLEAP